MKYVTKEYLFFLNFSCKRIVGKAPEIQESINSANNWHSTRWQVQLCAFRLHEALPAREILVAERGVADA